jgi:hypothetical protein
LIRRAALPCTASNLGLHSYVPPVVLSCLSRLRHVEP